MSDLTAVTTYGRGQAGARVRIFERLDRLVPDAVIHSYIGTSLNSPRTLLARPLATLAAERAVRRLADHSTERCSSSARPVRSGMAVSKHACCDLQNAACMTSTTAFPGTQGVEAARATFCDRVRQSACKA
jgi:hypothetical protein